MSSVADPQVVAVRTVWVVESNTDLTEGKGGAVVLYVCKSPATARRLAKGKGVQGTPAHIYERLSIEVRSDGRAAWYYPATLVRPSKEDTAEDERRAAREAATKRARELGLTDDEIEAISS